MSEHDEQVALFAWAQWQTPAVPELALLFAIPNGGHRHKATAAKMKAEGVKAGVLDVFLPVARNGRHGLFVEMKHGYNKPSNEQLWWLEQLEAQGYKTAVCYSFEAAQGEIMRYLGVWE